MVNAFDALVACRDDSLNDLADLTGDGHVDIDDFYLFRDALHQLEKKPGAPQNDLNGDGTVDEFEYVWPRADLNGSGRLARTGDERVVGDKADGLKLSDLQVMENAWQDDARYPRDKLKTMLDEKRK